MARGSRAPKSAPVPPENAEAGAGLVRQYVVQLYDRRDGKGVNWGLVTATLFKAAFEELDRLPERQRMALGGRVHAAAYPRMVGETEGEGRGVTNSPPPPPPGLSKAFSGKPPRPRAPH